nr:hypothetical protein [Tanacetum cinerariifolium]
IAQSSALPTVADEPASPGRDDSQGEAEEIARVLTSLDATNVLARETNVPT